MRKLLSLTLLLLLGVTTIYAQGMGNESRKSPHETVKGKNISITYGRPYKKGRVIFGDDKSLVPYGQVWRTGADEATEITLDRPTLFAGRQLDPGTYTLFTIPGKTEWTVILNKQLKQWGAFGYEKVKDKDVIKVNVPVTHHDNTVEEFTIAVLENGFEMAWDNTIVIVPVKFL